MPHTIECRVEQGGEQRIVAGGGDGQPILELVKGRAG
jgi:hypothetical protein